METIIGDTKTIGEMQQNQVCEAFAANTNERLFLMKISSGDMLNLETGAIVPISEGHTVTILDNALFLPFGM